MSTSQPPPGSGEDGWVPPAGWSPQQPPAWGAPPPPQQPPAAPPPPYGQPPYGQAPYGQPASPPPAYGQPPQYGQPSYGQPPYGQPSQYGQPPPPPGPWGAPGAWGQPAHPWGPPPPAPKPGIVPLRPIGVGELLDGALGLIRSNPRTVLGLAAAVSAISALIQTVGLWVALRAVGSAEVLFPVTGSATVSVDAADAVATQLTAAAAQAIPALMAGFLQVLASGLFIVLVAAAVLGRRLDAGATWQLLRPRLLPLIGLTLLLMLLGAAAIAALGGLVALLVISLDRWAIVPAILLTFAGIAFLVFAYVRLAVSSPALVIEGSGPLASMRRSWRLVRGSWWRVLGILLLSAIITNLLTTVISLPITGVALVLSGLEGDFTVATVIATGLATLVAGIVTMPFSAAVTGLLYTDLRMRREALDIQLVSAGVDPQGDPLAPYRIRGVSR